MLFNDKNLRELIQKIKTSDTDKSRADLYTVRNMIFVLLEYVEGKAKNTLFHMLYGKAYKPYPDDYLGGLVYLVEKLNLLAKEYHVNDIYLGIDYAEDQIALFAEQLSKTLYADEPKDKNPENKASIIKIHWILQWKATVEILIFLYRKSEHSPANKSRGIFFAACNNHYTPIIP